MGAIFALLEEKLCQENRSASQERNRSASVAQVHTNNCCKTPSTISTPATEIRRCRASTAPPELVTVNALQEWEKAVRKDPKCQTAEFCDILRTISGCMQQARKENSTPDYAELRSMAVERCKSMDAWTPHHDKYVRGLINAVRTPPPG